MLEIYRRNFYIFLLNSYFFCYYLYMKCKISLQSYINELQTHGRYWFLKANYLKESGASYDAFKQATYRLIKQNRIAFIAKGFYVIVPLEYKNRGILPTSWYIDPFMKHIDANYYVGLLTAASFYGVTHQQPQVFQLVTNKLVVLGKKNKGNLTFLHKASFRQSLTQFQKTETGYVNISTPETTALDLIQYSHLCGYWNNVGTVLAELATVLDKNKLAIAASVGKFETPTVQRLGYLLEHIGFSYQATKLHQYLQKLKPRYVALTPSYSSINAIKNKRWHLLVNDQVEIDL